MADNPRIHSFKKDTQRSENRKEIGVKNIHSCLPFCLMCTLDEGGVEVSCRWAMKSVQFDCVRNTDAKRKDSPCATAKEIEINRES